MLTKKNLFIKLGVASAMFIGITACNGGSSGGSAPFQALPEGTYSVTFANQDPAQCGTLGYESQLYSNGNGQLYSSPEDTSVSLALNVLANPCVNINQTDPVFGINFTETWSQCTLNNNILTASFYNSISGLGPDFDGSCSATITLTPLVQ